MKGGTQTWIHIEKVEEQSLIKDDFKNNKSDNHEKFYKRTIEQGIEIL